ncbi:MAG: hypothetical protein K0S39_776 [Paenibacillus sp.]|jgi:hypothetical protein|nr:hypothetical protein [Paenibacillus sp.]
MVLLTGKGAETMETNQTSTSKEQEQQARENKQEATAENGIIRDKKLEGPNRPSV